MFVVLRLFQANCGLLTKYDAYLKRLEYNKYHLGNCFHWLTIAAKVVQFYNQNMKYKILSSPISLNN